MAEELEEQLLRVESELCQVQEQISCLLEQQENLLNQQAELQGLLELYKCNNGGNGASCKAESVAVDWAGLFRWDKEAEDILLNKFGISSYRTNQREVVNAVMSSRDVVVIMAAGGGKSLCYQLPAVLMSGITLVISPLLSLIQDQIMGLTALGIPAAMLTSVTPKDEEKAVYKYLEKGEGMLKILYATPEKVSKSKRFMSKLEKANHAGRLSLMAIDEAHCCSQWGHDFRPDYKNLGILKKQFPKVPMIALTATATARVQADVKEMLQIKECVKFVSTVNRPNLFYEVREKSSNAQIVIAEISDFVKQAYGNKGSGIVYCFSRKECEQVAEELRKRGISAAYYHADMETAARSSVHHRWSSNKLQVIVGTVAFGMGINKPDVRFVIHHSLSKSLEAYYQESGRAGRDGLPSHCLLFYRAADLPRHSSMTFYEHAGLENLYSMVRFCQSKLACRRAAFFRHFGEALQECACMCDICVGGSEVINLDVTEHAKSIVLNVKELEDSDKKTTLLQLVDLLKSHSRKADLPLFKDLKKQQVEQILVQLILDGILKETFQHTAYSTNAYLSVGSLATLLLSGKRKIVLECNETKNQPAKIHTGKGLQKILESDFAEMLVNFCEELAQKHKELFPYAVLSSQQIAQLCMKKPSSVAQLQELLGKTKTEQFGNQLMDAINAYSKRNAAHAGDLISPKDSCSAAKGGPTKHGVDDITSTKPQADKAASSSVRTRKRKAHDFICIQDTDSDDN